VGETNRTSFSGVLEATFSILERIDVGETCPSRSPGGTAETFSILERIDVGETIENPLMKRLRR